MTDAHEELQQRLQNEAAHALEVTVELSRPIKVDGVPRSSLTIRRPTVGDMIQMQKRPGTEAEREVWLIAHLAAISAKDYMEADLADHDLCQAVLLGFREGRVAGP